MVVNKGESKMEVMTTGTLVRLLGISKEKYFRLEDSGKFPSARRTATGKRFFLTQDVQRLKHLLQTR